MALAEKLGFSFYDQEIIKMAAGTTGYTQDFISKKEESMTNSLLYDLVSQVYMYAQTNEEAPVPPHRCRSLPLFWPEYPCIH